MYKAIIQYKPLEVFTSSREWHFIENEPEQHKVIANTEKQAKELLVKVLPTGFKILEIIKL